MGTRGHGDCASRDGGVCKGARASNAARTALESYALGHDSWNMRWKNSHT